MIDVINTTLEELEDTVSRLTAGLKEPVYRGLSGKSLQVYEETGMMHPQSGSLAVGTGVFFALDLGYARGMGDGVIVIADLAYFRENNRIIDTTQTGYVDEFEKKLRLSLGRDPSGYETWDEVCKVDTIIKQVADKLIYTHRKPIHKYQLEYEIRIK